MARHTNLKWFVCCILFAASVLFALPFQVCDAEIAEGQALIDPTNPARAKQDAIHDAMRNFVEQKVGVHVQGETVVALGAIVRDDIVAKSDGYVLVNDVVKEWSTGDVYHVKLDLTANDDKIDTAVRDTKKKLQFYNATGNTTYNGTLVKTITRDFYNESGGCCRCFQ